VLRLGWTLGGLWRISRRLLEFFEALEGWGGGGFGSVGRRRGAAAVEFVVGFLVGFVGPLAGVGGVLFTPLAVGLPVTMMASSVAGSPQEGGA